MNLRLPITLVLFTVTLTACGSETNLELAPAAETAPTNSLPEGDGTRENPYVGRGFIEEVGAQQLLIQHEMIPGWMEAMQMAFPVTNDVDITNLSVGDQIRFEIELAGDFGYQVINIDPVGGE